MSRASCGDANHHHVGGHIITNIPGVTPMKPGSCTLPMYGIDVVVLDAQTGRVLEQQQQQQQHKDGDATTTGVLAIRQPWPGMARTCLNDHERYMNVYLKPYPGYYFTGDAVVRDADGYHFITGRVDDVLNVSGTCVVVVAEPWLVFDWRVLRHGWFVVPLYGIIELRPNLCLTTVRHTDALYESP